MSASPKLLDQYHRRRPHSPVGQTSPRKKTTDPSSLSSSSSFSDTTKGEVATSLVSALNSTSSSTSTASSSTSSSSVSLGLFTSSTPSALASSVGSPWQDELKDISVKVNMDKDTLNLAYRILSSSDHAKLSPKIFSAYVLWLAGRHRFKMNGCPNGVTLNHIVQTNPQSFITSMKDFAQHVGEEYREFAISEAKEMQTYCEEALQVLSIFQKIVPVIVKEKSQLETVYQVLWPLFVWSREHFQLKGKVLSASCLSYVFYKSPSYFKSESETVQRLFEDKIPFDKSEKITGCLCKILMLNSTECDELSTFLKSVNQLFEIKNYLAVGEEVRKKYIEIVFQKSGAYDISNLLSEMQPSHIHINKVLKMSPRRSLNEEFDDMHQRENLMGDLFTTMPDPKEFLEEIDSICPQFKKSFDARKEVLSKFSDIQNNDFFSQFLSKLYFNGAKRMFDAEKKRIEQDALTRWIKNEAFHDSLFACCFVVSVYLHKLKNFVKFGYRDILKEMKLPVLNFFSMIESFLKSYQLSSELFLHLRSIENEILDCVAWEDQETYKLLCQGIAQSSNALKHITSPDRPKETSLNRSQVSNPRVEYFYRKFYSHSFDQLNKIKNQLRMNQDLFEKVWDLFVQLVVKESELELLKNRNSNLITVYCIFSCWGKTSDRPQIKRISQAMSLICSSNYFGPVNCQDFHLEVKELDVVNFYNRCFLKRAAPLLRNHELPKSPTPSLHKAKTPSMAAIKQRTEYPHSPTDSITSVSSTDSKGNPKRDPSSLSGVFTDSPIAPKKPRDEK